ncbi:hypothetical protein K449DRAFT_122680 [Hypoxylon sp. EC38]|nr:hypothetical protein K449DRAFT_122680 [Hypoxylon sp. EC38]
MFCSRLCRTERFPLLVGYINMTWFKLPDDEFSSDKKFEVCWAIGRLTDADSGVIYFFSVPVTALLAHSLIDLLS